MTDWAPPSVADGPLLAWARTHEPALAHAAQGWFRPAPHHFGAAVSRWCLDLNDAAALLDALPDQLLPAAMARVAGRRRRSFVAGRLCAERCLAQWAVWGPVARGPVGEPVWPFGFIGSITHNTRLACAAVRRCSPGFGLGIDSELVVGPDACVEIERLCCSGQERARWASMADRCLVVTLIFSAKEALYKAIHQRVGRFVDFLEVEVTELDWHGGVLTICPLPGSELAPLVPAAQCHFCIDEGMVHTSVEIPSRPLP